MKRYTNFQLTKDIITKLSTATITCEVDFENCDITATHIDENGIKYVLSVFYEDYYTDEIDDYFIARLKDSGIKFNWLQVLEGGDVIFEGERLIELDDMSFDFIINSLKELAKKNNEERIRLAEEEENRLKNLAKKFGIL
ncbi:MAG: hypothetical protein J6R59_01945 [Paludibacteraceae bacterium]|nr:hypothetical protein [Paludibacteraceae bacterium]